MQKTWSAFAEQRSRWPSGRTARHDVPLAPVQRGDLDAEKGRSHLGPHRPAVGKRGAADPGAYISASPERVAAYRLVWRGELSAARASLGSLLALADERGDSTSYATVRMHIVELELRAGNFDAAERLLDEWGQSADFETQFRPQYPRCRALLDAGRGRAADGA
jgi:hypothetical protein